MKCYIPVNIQDLGFRRRMDDSCQSIQQQELVHLKKELEIIYYPDIDLDEDLEKELVPPKHQSNFETLNSHQAVLPRSPSLRPQLYRLNQKGLEGMFRLRRFLRLINPLLAFFPQAVLEDIVWRMMVCPKCEHRPDDKLLVQILAFVESYLRARGLSLLVSTLKQIQSVLSFPLTQQAIFKEYYRLKRAQAPLYPAYSLSRVIKGLIGHLLSTLDVSSTIKRSILHKMQMFLPKKQINYPELHAWVIIRRILHSEGLRELPRHPDAKSHNKILQLEYQIRKEKRNQPKEEMPKEISAYNTLQVFPEEFKELLKMDINIPPHVLAQLALCYIKFLDNYRGRNLLIPLVAAIIYINCCSYLGMNVRQLCQKWQLSRGQVYQFVKLKRSIG